MSTIAPPSALGQLPRRSPRPSVTRLASFAFSLLTLAFLLLMLGLFLVQSLPVWKHSGAGFITGTQDRSLKDRTHEPPKPMWHYPDKQFGSLLMLYGTAVVALIALALAAPVGIGAAIFTSEYLPRRPRLAFKLTIELLAGIPSVVYGLLGILFLRNYVYDALTRLGLDPLSGDTLLTAGILLAVMILPTVMTLTDDALRAVSAQQRVAARGLGLTRTQVICTIALPQARSGILAAILLALGRALGETIAVFLVVGRQDNVWPQHLLSLRPIIKAGQTLTTKLGGAEVNIAYGDPLHWAAIVALGLLLLVVVVAVTWIGAALGRRSTIHA
jgi:phosphate transport system permease protein